MNEGLIEIFQDPQTWLAFITVVMSVFLVYGVVRLSRTMRSVRFEIDPDIIKNDKSKPEPPKDPPDQPKPSAEPERSVKDRFIGNLAVREFRHRTNARLFITGVLLAVMLGIGLFLRASLNMEHNGDIDLVQDRLDFIAMKLNGVNEVEGTGAKVLRDSVGRVTSEYYVRYNCKTCYPDSLRFDSVMAKQDRLSKTLLDVLDPMTQATYDLSKIKGSSYENRVLDLVTLTLIRAGIIIILVFAVQILLRVYRYHVRSADHYRAVIDTLTLASHENMTAKEVFEMVHGNIDVEKDPQLPLDKIIDMINKLKG